MRQSVWRSGRALQAKRALATRFRVRTTRSPVSRLGLGVFQRCSPSVCLQPCKPSHPSPSAREFRLLLNGLATSELRRMLLQRGRCVRAWCPTPGRPAAHRCRASLCRPSVLEPLECHAQAPRRPQCARNRADHPVAVGCFSDQLPCSIREFSYLLGTVKANRPSCGPVDEVMPENVVAFVPPPRGGCAGRLQDVTVHEGANA
jgi:hypothetical protein